LTAIAAGCGSSETGSATTPQRCNGSEALCDRSLPETVIAATHNSMSAPLPGWRSVQQDAPIAVQLQDGVRGLLIDTHYGWRTGDRVRTDLRDRADSLLAARQDPVSATAARLARGVRDRLHPRPDADRRMYLCHSFCELGATPLESVLADLRRFMRAHRREVLVIVNQDYVEPGDFVQAVRDAGLERYAFTAPARTSWPTLREMIDSGRRILFAAENEAGAAPWYGAAFERTVQDTPYSFSRASRLTSSGELAGSCKLNRGWADAPVFLMNHWVTTDPRPLRANARRVNAYDVLSSRARECDRVRARLPSVLAVDFYRQGDVFRVAARLNE
jgi:hypothetical protein